MNPLAELDAAILSLQALRARLSAVSPSVEYIDQDDVKARYKVSRRTYLEAARAGAFQHEKVGRQVRTRVDIFEAWLSSQRRTPRPHLVRGHNAIEEAHADLDAAVARIMRRGAR